MLLIGVNKCQEREKDLKRRKLLSKLGKCQNLIQIEMNKKIIMDKDLKIFNQI